ncbi:MAG: HAD family hydrolase [Caldilineaceae bacterium]|nr:HAD family hydrolase [Caldilineaceae bacterium]MCB9124033.1 HAD family hydrolase [Caldilineaceae bacterium]HRW46358.1 HAD family hydrolase [Caldilinea sp.]
MSQTHPFDLVVLDLDGTIINAYERAPISQAVHDTIAAVQALGVPVTIGSGRTLDYIRNHIPGDLRLTHPVIATQGAVIGDPVTGHVLAEVHLPLDSARAIAGYVDAHGYPTAFYFNDAAGHTRIMQNMAGRTPQEEETFHHLLGHPVTLVDSFSPLLADDGAHPPVKVMAYNHNLPDPVDLLIEYERRFAPPLSITRSHEWLVETTAPGVDKGSGLHRLCDMLGVSIDRVLAIGDSDNDIPMLRAAGFGIAMGNAAPHVKAVARWVAPAIEEDGAAVALRRWILDA